MSPQPRIGKVFTGRALSTKTLGAYAAMVERHGGVFGSCWCTWFHRPAGDSPGVDGLGQGYERNRQIKEALVHEGRSRAGLVFDGEQVVAWCQYGTPEDPPNIYHRKQYLRESERLPDYRVTCIFVDKRYRRRGLSALVLGQALSLIAAAGGGVVEGYPHDTPGKRQSVLYNGTRELFERAGFAHLRSKDSANAVMVKTVSPLQGPGGRPARLCTPDRRDPATSKPRQSRATVTSAGWRRHAGKGPQTQPSGSPGAPPTGPASSATDTLGADVSVSRGPQVAVRFLYAEVRPRLASSAPSASPAPSTALSRNRPAVRDGWRASRRGSERSAGRTTGRGEEPVR